MGVRCAYDGKARPLAADVAEQLALFSGGWIPVCPEQLGELPTPRRPVELLGGSGLDVLQGNARVVSSDGQDVTRTFLRGAEETLYLARRFGCTEALLKARSPSCGVKQHYDGSFTGRLVSGSGVTAAALCRAGLRVVDSDEGQVLRPGAEDEGSPH